MVSIIRTFSEHYPLAPICQQARRLLLAVVPKSPRTVMRGSALAERVSTVDYITKDGTELLSVLVDTLLLTLCSLHHLRFLLSLQGRRPRDLWA